MPQSQMNDYSKLLSMNNYMNPAGAAKPPSMLGAASEMDMFNRGMGAESWLMPPGSMKRGSFFNCSRFLILILQIQ